MADIRVPSNVSSITFVTSGVKTPVNNIITNITAAEATDVTSPYSKGPGTYPVVTTAANGDVDMFMPASITNITIGGVAKAVSGGIITAVAPAAATNFILTLKQRDSLFELVTG